MNRRSFLGASALALGAMTVFKGVAAKAKDAAKKFKESQIFTHKEVSTVAEFCRNAEKDKKECPTRQKPERKGQHCGICQFYTKQGVDEKGKEVGKCLLIPKKGEKEVVPATGWCASWTKKQG